MVDELLPDVFDITVRQTDRRIRAYLVLAEVPLLIDAGFEDSVDALFAGIDEVGTEPERLVITHGDPDHVDGYDAVVDRYDLETWVPQETDLDAEAEPDHRYGDGEVIGPFQAVYTPGHEPDHHSLIDEEAGVLVAGDALFGADFRGFPGGYLIPPPALYSENLNRAEESLERLLEFDFDAALVFHGSSVLEGAHDRLDAFVNFPEKPESASYV